MDSTGSFMLPHGFAIGSDAQGPRIEAIYPYHLLLSLMNTVGQRLWMLPQQPIAEECHTIEEITAMLTSLGDAVQRGVTNCDENWEVDTQ